MSNVTRREFVAAATAAAVTTRAAVAAGDSMVMALIGCGGQGNNVAGSFAGEKSVQFAYVCDPDQGHAEKTAERIHKISGRKPRIVADMRKVLDDKSIDAVVVATPDHWHAPATWLACQAGKHVYVEKPASHNVKEGRLMIDAAREAKRVVQVGTQSRSAPHIREAIALLKDGAIGEVLVAKAWNSQLRRDIGHAKPSAPPSNVDYELWLGAAPYVPFQSNRFHYGWHWWYDFGTGDMGNDGVHDIDIARWGLGVETHPTTVSALGSKLAFDDDQQFPDTQYVVFEWAVDGRPKRQLVYEQRIWSPYVQEGYENGNAFYGTKGILLLGKGLGWTLFGPKNTKLKEMKASGMGKPHHLDFLDAVRNNRKPNADIEINHLSSSLCHLGNIGARVGRTLKFDPAKERILNDPQADQLLGRSYREGHWAAPRVEVKA